MPESFSEAIALTPTGEGVFQAAVTADWSQGRAAFGGLVSGQMLRAVQSLLPPLPLRTMVLDFLAPASPGAVLRTGRSMSRVEVQLHQGETYCATMRAAFGLKRTTALTHLPLPAAASSVTWMVNLVGDLVPAPPEHWWHFEAELISSMGGFSDTESRLWSPDGQLVATSRQLVA